MKAYKTRLNDGRIFYVAHYSKSEAVSLLAENMGIDRTDVKRVTSVPDEYVDADTTPCLLDADPND